jgi:itaconyl-CoA hydratase/mesaconyl-C4 CoA hydratase
MDTPDMTAWVGRQHQTCERLSASLVERIAATLGEPAPRPGEALPPLWHWAFFQDPTAPAQLGRDGHPALGGFLPPAHGRNRMWAGSRLSFHRPLQVDAEVTCLSTVLKVEEKHGRTGSLLFVTVAREYQQHDALALHEEQDIVYREPTPPKLGGTQALPEGQWHEAVSPDPILLFRYSAVTFNGHRIHYDYPYATEVEGYPGLVVHGPLIATLAVRAFVRAHPRARLHGFSFRGVRPLICPTPFDVGGRISEPGVAQVWAGNQDGTAQSGEIHFSEGVDA